MARIRVPISNFQYGEISPSLVSRTDTPLYNNSAKKVENFFLRNEGGLLKRFGTKRIYEFDTTVDSSATQQLRLVPFIFSDDERYIVSLENAKIRIFQISPTTGAVSLIQTLTQDVDSNDIPFTNAKLPELTYAQSGDIMFIAHQTFMVRKLVRTSLTTFQLEVMTFDTSADGFRINQPYYSFQGTGVTLDPSASTGNGVTITTSANYFDTTGSQSGGNYPNSKHIGVVLRYHNNEIEISFSKFGLLTINNSALKQSIEIVRRRIDDVGTKEPTILQRGEKRILVELTGLKDPERIKSLLGQTAQLNFRLVSENDEFGSEELISENGEKLFVSKRIVMSGENLIDAQPSIQNQNNEPTVSFTLDRLGAQKFGRATTDNVGKRLAIVLDGEIVSAPNINEPITSGNGMISGNFTFQEATDLALLLRSGALPTPLLVVEERTVGPDLGEDSIRSGVTSLIIGFVLVILFMFFKYRIFGLIANTALIANLIMLVGILTILEATLTLPGIAGIILTVGMAVDANVLIFERIKEELKTEKSIIHAFDSGYARAKITVLDANITTLIAAAILFAFGSGPVKGFAITLGIGIVTTLFTAYFLARHLTSLVVLNNNKEIKI